MSKIIFIEPKAPNFHIFSKFHLPRIGIFILGTLMKNRGWDVEIIVEDIEPANFDLLKTADIVAISTITSTAPRAYLIADKVRSMGIDVLMGGPHVTYMSDEALEHVDFVIRGEGEQALMSFINAWEGDSDFSRIPNLSYMKDGVPVHNKKELHNVDLNSLPWPDFTLMKGGIKTVMKQNIIPIQTSRGCPFDCSFCSVTRMFGRKYRFRSTEHIMGELRQYNSPGNFIFFYDDNFTANPRRAKELLRTMINERFRFKWSTQVRVDVARDPDLIRLMKTAGCHTVFIGFESVNPKSLMEMNKKQGVDDIKTAINAFNKNQIHIHGMFVFGFDEDNWSSVEETMKFAKKSRLTSYQFLILTPLPGSEFYYRMKKENRLLAADWSLYDTHHVVFKPNRFIPAELQWAQIYSHKKVYSIPQLFSKLLNKNLTSVGLSLYARRLNRHWQRENKQYLRAIGVI